jgi:hypothetical protein
MTRNTIPTFILIVLASCKIEGNFAGLYSYYDKAKQSNAALFVETDTVTGECDLIYGREPKVYLINGRQLKECVSGADDALVYIWKLKCSSQFCYSLNRLQNYCDSVGQELFIVAEYYDAETIGLRYSLQHPIFGINTNLSLRSKSV